MNKNILWLTFPLLLALPLSCQEKGQEPEKQKPAAAPHKDDAVTAKDIAVKAIDAFIKTDGPAKKEGSWRTRLSKPPKVAFDPQMQYQWHLLTNKGEIGIKLLPETAPMHVSSTIYLARLGYYDGLSFHRVITGFMAQGGCPLGTGTGGPGYKYDGEFDDRVQHDKAGKLSMANAGPGTDGSQFFLTFRDTPFLNGKHTIFGEIQKGMDVLKALEACGSKTGKPTEPLTIEQTWIQVEPATKPAVDKPKDAPAKDKK